MYFIEYRIIQNATKQHMAEREREYQPDFIHTSNGVEHDIIVLYQPCLISIVGQGSSPSIILQIVDTIIYKYEYT